MRPYQNLKPLRVSVYCSRTWENSMEELGSDLHTAFFLTKAVLNWAPWPDQILPDRLGLAQCQFLLRLSFEMNSKIFERYNYVTTLTLSCNDWTIILPLSLSHLNDPCYEHSIMLPCWLWLYCLIVIICILMFNCAAFLLQPVSWLILYSLASQLMHLSFVYKKPHLLRRRALSLLSCIYQAIKQCLGIPLYNLSVTGSSSYSWTKCIVVDR